MNRTMRAWAVLACAVACAAACGRPKDRPTSAEQANAPASAEASNLLGAETNPVRCDMPAGQRAYLSRLRGPDGKPPRFRRVGSFATGPYGNILDGYEVTSGSNTVMVFMDMYHPGHVETNAVPGFTIVEK